MGSLTAFDWHTWVILPLLIFLARIVDVTLGTLRIVFVSRGKKQIAPFLGFVEVFIWITVVSQVVSGASNILAYLAYAAGFAAGNFVGLQVEDKLAIGTLVVRVILAEGGDELVRELHNAGYGATRVDAKGANGPVKLIYTVVKRKDLPLVTAIIHRSHPRVFVSIEDVRSTEEGIFPPRVAQAGSITWNRKSK